MYIFWRENLTGLILCIVLGQFLYAQSPVMVNRLPESGLEIKEKAHFFLADVEDRRSGSAVSIGHVVHLTKRTPLNLNSNLENIAFDFWAGSLNQRNPKGVPLIVRINTLSFSENREAPGKIKGESVISVEFLWLRGENEISLTRYNSKSNYTRPESKPVHDDFLAKMLADALLFFDKWMTANNGRNPSLVRGIRLVLEDDESPSKADTVFYATDRPLSYADFKAAPRPGRYAAMVFTSLSYEGSSRVVDNYLEVLIKLKVYVVKSMSWMKPESKTPRVLKHEQTHFDIAKISAERFKRELLKLDLTIEDHDSQIQYQFLESYREMHRLQEAYDRETRHGLNPEAQLNWENMVSNELRGTSPIKIQ